MQCPCCGDAFRKWYKPLWCCHSCQADFVTNGFHYCMIHKKKGTKWEKVRHLVDQEVNGAQVPDRQ